MTEIKIGDETKELIIKELDAKRASTKGYRPR
jgi:hypothetical protein